MKCVVGVVPLACALAQDKSDFIAMGVRVGDAVKIVRTAKVEKHILVADSAVAGSSEEDAVPFEREHSSRRMSQVT